MSLFLVSGRLTGKLTNLVRFACDESARVIHFMLGGFLVNCGLLVWNVMSVEKMRGWDII
jgi:hypothetical protein